MAVKELDSIIREMQKLKLTPDEIQRALKPSGDRILQFIYANIPVRTGNLLDSYGYVKRKYNNGLTIGAKYKRAKGSGSTAHLIELGFTTRNGVKVQGKFIEQKAFEANREAALNSMAKNLGDVIADKWNK